MAAIECSHVPSPRASGKLINHFSGSQQSAADDISLGPGKRSSLLEKKTWDSRRGSFPWADRSLGALVIVVTPPPAGSPLPVPLGGGEVRLLPVLWGCWSLVLDVAVFGPGSFGHRCSGCWSLVGAVQNVTFLHVLFLC